MLGALAHYCGKGSGDWRRVDRKVERCVVFIISVFDPLKSAMTGHLDRGDDKTYTVYELSGAAIRLSGYTTVVGQGSNLHAAPTF